MTEILQATPDAIRHAAAYLAQGGLVAFPTETVYGLGADATNDRAVAAIFAAKGRPAINPVIAHFAEAAQARAEVVFTPEADHLAALFWPGPLTLILPRRADTRLSLLCAAGLPTQGVRVPAHPVARGLIAALGKPIAAPSANASGSLSPTAAAHVARSLDGRVGLILAGGKSDVGLESTVVDLTGPVPALLRHGGITAEELREALDGRLILGGDDRGAPKSPGQLLKHYAPATPLRLRAVDVARDEALLAFGPLRFMGVKEGGFAKDLPPRQVMNLSESGDLTEAAGNLFSMLHALDAQGFPRIAVMDVPQTGLGSAINDRLRRAVAAQDH